MEAGYSSELLDTATIQIFKEFLMMKQLFQKILKKSKIPSTAALASVCSLW